jgi:hypothetical protein
MWLEHKELERKATGRAPQDRGPDRDPRSHPDDVRRHRDAGPRRLCVKIAGRIDRKVDGDKVQELAAEHGLTDHLSRLFRWKPEINMAAWKASDPSITQALAPAITAKPGRPSFAIELIKE